MPIAASCPCALCGSAPESLAGKHKRKDSGLQRETGPDFRDDISLLWVIGHDMDDSEVTHVTAAGATGGGGAAAGGPGAAEHAGA